MVLLSLFDFDYTEPMYGTAYFYRAKGDSNV